MYQQGLGHLMAASPNVPVAVVFYLLFTSPDASFGLGKYAFPLISMLQYYWQFKIAQALLKKFLPGKKPASAAAVKKAA